MLLSVYCVCLMLIGGVSLTFLDFSGAEFTFSFPPPAALPFYFSFRLDGVDSTSLNTAITEPQQHCSSCHWSYPVSQFSLTIHGERRKTCNRHQKKKRSLAQMLNVSDWIEFCGTIDQWTYQV